MPRLTEIGKHFIIVCLLFLFGCRQPTNDFKIINTEKFKISVPKTWNFIEEPGEDSFVGFIEAPDLRFSFDFSENGYANHLLKSEQEYLKSGEWELGCIFCKSGVSYNHTPDLDSKIETHIPTTAQKNKYPKADYIADMTYNDSTAYVPIKIPAEIKAHNIEQKSEGAFIIKIIWPKIPSKGTTGVYYQSKSSTLNFQLSAHNLSKQDQDLALQAFKTIVIKTK